MEAEKEEERGWEVGGEEFKGDNRVFGVGFGFREKGIGEEAEWRMMGDEWNEGAGEDGCGGN